MISMVILTLGVIVTVALIYGSRRWESATKKMHARLEAARLPAGRKTYSYEELIGMPEPVQKYFRTVLKEGQPIVLAVHVELSGTINMSATAESWKRFTSTQLVIAQRPGFDWEGRIEMFPGLTGRVHDAYIAGEGILHASLFGLVSLANLRGTPDIAQGELMRLSFCLDTPRANLAGIRRAVIEYGPCEGLPCSALLALPVWAPTRHLITRRRRTSTAG